MCSVSRNASPLKLRVMSKTASPRRKPWSRNGIRTSLSRTILPLNQATRSLLRAIAIPSSVWSSIIVPASQQKGAQCGSRSQGQERDRHRRHTWHWPCHRRVVGGRRLQRGALRSPRGGGRRDRGCAKEPRCEELGQQDRCRRD